MSDPRDEAAEKLDVLAEELERAAQHCRVAAQHYRDRLIPRAAAHAWAAHGHIHRISTALDGLAESHADHSVPQAD
ncbi:MAG: hypothetical protein WBW04_15855 [Nitrolancea sp.]